MTLNDKSQFTKRSSENLFSDSSLQPPQKRHSIDLTNNNNFFLTRSNSAPQSRIKFSRSSSPIRLSRRRHPYQLTKFDLPLTPTKSNSENIDLPSLTIHTKHTSIDNGLPSPINSPNKNINKEQSYVIINNFADLTLLPTPTNEPCHQIFKIPEIVDNILRNLYIMESQQVNDIERTSSSRNGTISSTSRVSSTADNSHQLVTTASPIYQRRGSLHNCTMINKLWNELSMKYLLRDLTFKDSNKLMNFAMNSKFIYKGTKNQANYPRSITLYKLNRFNTEDLSIGFGNNNTTQDNIHFNNLQSLQFYICPNLLPMDSWFKEFKNLKKLSLPGNKRIDDKFMIEISLHLENLEHLDLRACYNITDVGVVSIASRCKKLKLINLGRHKNGQAITDVSLVALSKYTNVETVGIAGCHITDSGLWEFAKNNGENVKRLSLNNCKGLTNMSIPYLVSYNYLPKLVVLEIRDIDNLTNVKPLIKYKLWKKAQNSPLLIESCNRITKLLSFEEEKMKKKRALASLREMQHWINESEDDK